MSTSTGVNLELSRCIAASPVCHLKSSIFETRSCVPKFQGFSKKLLPLCKDINARSNREKNITFSVTCSASQVGTAADEPSILTYKDAGVDIDAGSELARRIAKMAPGIEGFGGLFPLGDSYLVAGTDGVGTKLKLAFETGIHDTIGIDLVAMSVNDIVTSGAKPLFFLDYFATSLLDVDLAEKIAEMPDFYAEGECDLSGFAVGIVKKDSVIEGKSIKVGDVLIGLPSSGVHSNGFSLVRRVLKQSGLSLKDQLPGETITLGEALIAPTVIYVKQARRIVLERD
ncbi:Phosphoribosylformylglycinamidine cyclo-ligase [Capsicum annuum]|uniref:phosphoribosylformylglycinamidine cyclo-ligase n=1 Tax=Capsicum annuum TaxID=4072 RepID=A0A2G2ZP73_CAPAN|nr:Phosphoribosylformylglycinamidine cyclo-ligase [Capsicum annuum]PHT83773.1 Phosphoribosylformylglycinamidine cyclo-ligase [Capsicum annuum]